jgi:hypothetical protein
LAQFLSPKCTKIQTLQTHVCLIVAYCFLLLCIFLLHQYSTSLCCASLLCIFFYAFLLRIFLHLFCACAFISETPLACSNVEQINLRCAQWMQVMQIILKEAHVWREDLVTTMELDNTMSIGSAMKCLCSSSANIQSMLEEKINHWSKSSYDSYNTMMEPRLWKSFKTRSICC